MVGWVGVWLVAWGRRDSLGMWCGDAVSAVAADIPCRDFDIEFCELCGRMSAEILRFDDVRDAGGWGERREIR